MLRALLHLLLPVLPVSAAAVEPAFVPITYPGGTSGVDSSFAIGMFEVTNPEYAAFLNAVAASDPHGLYAAGTAGQPHQGIVRSGSAGSYSYAVKPGFERLPVVFVNGFSAMRYCNWLHNGMGSGGTETGTYTVADGFTAARQPGARFFLPSFAQWYKASYWQPPLRAGDPALDGVDAGFWGLPGRGNGIFDFTRLTNGHLTDPNQYNVLRAVTGRALNDPLEPTFVQLSRVGAYVATRGWFGLYDAGGNANEIVEDPSYLVPDTRSLVGSSCLLRPSEMEAGRGGIAQMMRATDTEGFRASGFRLAARLGPAGYDGGEIGFISAGLSAATDVQPAQVVVRRIGGIGTVSVTYATSNGTASAGSDYTAVSGTLTFGPGDSTKTIAIPFTPGNFTGSGKTIRLRLNDPVGGAVLGRHDGTELRISPVVTAPALTITRTYVTPGAVALGPDQDIAVGEVDRFTPLVNANTPNGFVRVHYDLTNTGNAAVSIDQYVMTAVQNCTVSPVNTLPSSTIAPGATVTLEGQIVVTTKDQPWAATWTFGSNLPGQPQVGWTMANATSTAGLAPTLRVERWGTVAPRSTDVVRHSRSGVGSDLAYAMAVDGVGALTLSAPTFAGAVNATVSVVEAPSGTLRAGEHATLRLRVTPTAAGSWSVPVSLGIAGQPVRTWTISGQAAAAGADQEPVIEDTYRMPRNGALPLLVRGVDPDGPAPAVLAVGAPSSGTLTRLTGPVIAGSGAPVAQAWAYVFKPANNAVGTVTVPVTLAHAGGSVVRSLAIAVEPAPEIEIRRGPSSLALFGESTLTGVVVGQPYRTLLSVHNIGTAPLTLLPAFKSSNSSRVQSVTVGTLGSLVLPPNTSTSVPVTVVVNEAGAFFLQVVIGNDDVDESPFTLKLQGTAATSADNQPPVALAQRIVTTVGTPVAITLGGIDPEGAAISAGTVGSPGKGTLTGSGLTRTYTPNAGYVGSDSFTYTVSDGSLASASVTVNITVQAAAPAQAAPVVAVPAVASPADLVLP